MRVASNDRYFGLVERRADHSFSMAASPRYVVCIGTRVHLGVRAT